MPSHRVGGDRYVDVTTLLKAYIKGNRLSVLVTNWTMCGGRNPYYGDQKRLVVEYSVGNGPLREIVSYQKRKRMMLGPSSEFFVFQIVSTGFNALFTHYQNFG
jgi:hypothetical protein